MTRPTPTCRRRPTPPRSPACPLMWPARLPRAAARGRRPRRRWASVAGDAPLDPVLADAVRRRPTRSAGGGRAARRRPPEAVWERCQRAGVAVHLLGEPGYPSVLAADPSRRPSCSPAATSTRSTAPGRGRRHPHATATGRGPSPHELGPAWPRPASGRVGPGPRHRRLGPPRRASRRCGAARRRGGQRARRRLPRRAPPASGSEVAEPGPAAQRGAARHRARAPGGSRPATGSSPRWPSVVVVVESRATRRLAAHRRRGRRRGIAGHGRARAVRSPASAGTNQLLADGATRCATPPTCSWPSGSRPAPTGGRAADRAAGARRDATGGARRLRLASPPPSSTLVAAPAAPLPEVGARRSARLEAAAGSCATRRLVRAGAGASP